MQEENLEMSFDLDFLADEAEAIDEGGPTGRPVAPEGPVYEDAEEDGHITAALLTEMAEQTAVSLWPFLEYDDKTRERVTEKLAAVIAKRGGEMPPWLLAYREELQLVGLLSLVVIQTRRQIREHDRAEAEQETPEKTPQEREETPKNEDSAWLAAVEPVGNA